MMRVQAMAVLTGILGILSGQISAPAADPDTPQERSGTAVRRVSVDSLHHAHMDLSTEPDDDHSIPLHRSPLDDEHRRAEKQARYREIRERLERFLSHLESPSRSASASRQRDQSEETTGGNHHTQLPDAAEQHSADAPSDASPETASDSRSTVQPLSPVDPSGGTLSAEHSVSEASGPSAFTATEQPRSAPSAVQDTHAPEEAAQQKQDMSVPDLSVAGVSAVDGPVDRVALGDNLFAIQEYRLALESYLQVDVRKLPRDHRFWVQYQVAACHRHLNDLPAARKQLRILAGQEEAGWLGRAARWWLDTLRDRAELEQQLAALEEQIQQRKEHSDARSP